MPMSVAATLLHEEKCTRWGWQSIALFALFWAASNCELESKKIRDTFSPSFLYLHKFSYANYTKYIDNKFSSIDGKNFQIVFA